jgi:LPS export ABC transporter protein LptC
VRARYVAPLVLFLALILAVLIFMGLGLRPPVAESATVAREPPRYVVTDAQWLRLNLRGEPEFRAQAQSIEYYADDTVELRTLALDALGGWTSPWHVQAPEGTARVNDRRLLLSGDVVAQGKTIDGAQLDFTTERLWVDLLRRELRTDHDVVFQSDFRRATARGLKADFNGEHIQLLNDVQMEYAPEG